MRLPPRQREHSSCLRRRLAITAVILFVAGWPIAHAQMPWDPFIIECMDSGRNRAECYDALPPELLAELEAYEAQQRQTRRAQRELRESLNTTDSIFGQADEKPDQASAEPDQGK